MSRKFSSGEKVLIIIALPLVNFFSLSASSALKGTDIVKFSEGISYIDLGLFFYYLLYFNLYNSTFRL